MAKSLVLAEKPSVARDIAKVLNLPESSVKTRLCRARAIIKDKLKIILED